MYFPNRSNTNPRILNIACGTLNEEHAIYELFGKNTELIGIDNDKMMLSNAEDLNRQTVMYGDLENLDTYINGKFDLVLGRNVPLNPGLGRKKSNVSDPWPNIFSNLKKYMTKNSQLFLTLVREDENKRAKEILTDNDYKITFTKKNNIIVPKDYINVHSHNTKDNYIVIAKS
ncbi:MAG: class I SAM-dependent methyltransferase [archaeon]